MLIERFLGAASDQAPDLLLVCYRQPGSVRATGRGRGVEGLYTPSRLVRISTAASTFAGLPVSGRSEDRREITLNSCVECRFGAVGRVISGGTYDRLDGMHRQPSFSRIFVSVLIVARRMLERRVNGRLKLIELQHTRIEMQTEPSE